MALFLFENIKTGETRDIFFKMNDVKVYNGESGDEVGVWERRYYAPNASIDTKIDPFSSSDFVRKTENKKGSYGSLLDASKEAGLARQQKAGFDPVKEDSIRKWKKDRLLKSGKERTHPSEINRGIDVTV